MELEIDPERVIKFCPFCGEKLMIDISQLCEIIDAHDNDLQTLTESLPGSDGERLMPAEFAEETGSKEKEYDEIKAAKDEGKSTNDKDDDEPVWFDPPIEEEPKWKRSLRWVFRIIVIIFPILLVGKVVSIISPLGIFGVLIIFVLLIYLAVK